MYELVREMDEEHFYDISRQCFEEMRTAGVTTVGEFHYFHHDKPDAGSPQYAYDQAVLRAARDAGLRMVLLSAFYQYSGFNKAPLEPAQERFKSSSEEEYWAQMDRVQASLDPSTQSLGVVAHSIRAVGLDTIVALAQEARHRGLVMHMHLEEQPLEVEECIAVHGKTPMALLLENDVVWDGFTAVHCTHTTPEDMVEFVARGGNVCICPLTEGNLGDGIANLSQCGGRISLGSDCNARIDLIEEMRWLEYVQRVQHVRRGMLSTLGRPGHAPGEALGPELFECATGSGARALGVDVGRIAPECWADFTVVQLGAPALKGWHPETLMESILFGCSGEQVVDGTCVAGEWRL